MNMEGTGRMIAAARQGKGWTQKQLADKLKLSDKAVSKWERGLSFPDVSMLTELAETLDLTISELLTGERAEIVEKDDKAVKTAVEVSSREIKGLSKKHKIIISVLATVAALVIVALSVCFGIAFTPADDYTTDKKDSITVQTISGGDFYTLPISGRVSVYPPNTQQTVKTKLSNDKIIALVEKAVNDNGDTYEYVSATNMLIYRDNGDGTRDSFYFKIDCKKDVTLCTLSSLAENLILFKDEIVTEQTIIFPVCYLKEQTSYFMQSAEYSFMYEDNSLGADVKYEQRFKTSVDKICAFYADNAYFNTVRDGYNSLVVKPTFDGASPVKIVFMYKPDALQCVLSFYIEER